jgi:prepilin-type N-terminal cleavage/methylation domain-containing protein
MKSIKKRNQDAFSFIEILLVVVIVSTLAAIAIPSLGWIKKDATSTKKAVAINRIAEAKEQFYQENRTTNRFRAPHEPPDATLPDAARLLPYLNLKAGTGTNALYSNSPESLFAGCFPKDEVWYLNPNGKDQQPSYEKVNPTNSPTP